MWPVKRRTVVAAGLVAVALALAIVADQAIGTLRALTVVERDRDTWQRREEVLRPLDLRPGQTVVDLGSGAGYFALKMAPREQSFGLGLHP
jgi:predicted methyltransferase